MNEAIGQILPFAVGVGLSPFPIIASRVPSPPWTRRSPPGQEAIALAVFVVIGTIGVGGPLVIYFALGERSAHILEGLKSWMAANNTVIMAILMLIIGAKLVGDGISGL